MAYTIIGNSVVYIVGYVKKTYKNLIIKNYLKTDLVKKC